MLTRACGDERGSAPVDAVFSVVFLLVLGLGVTQVAFLLYGRNTLMSSTHEAARAALEWGRTQVEAASIAERRVREAAGGLVDHMDVEVVTAGGASTSITVIIEARLRAAGPLPMTIPFTTKATVETDEALSE